MPLFRSSDHRQIPTSEPSALHFDKSILVLNNKPIRVTLVVVRSGSCIPPPFGLIYCIYYTFNELVTQHPSPSEVHKLLSLTETLGTFLALHWSEESSVSHCININVPDRQSQLVEVLVRTSILDVGKGTRRIPKET